MRGRDRSPAAALVDTLGSYVVDPTDLDSERRAIEVFPAPTWLELFGLADRVRYKRGRLAERTAALGVLRRHLDSLADGDPPLRVADVDTVADRAAEATTGRQWKAVEDIIDARLCAYVAMHWDRAPDMNWVVTAAGS